MRDSRSLGTTRHSVKAKLEVMRTRLTNLDGQRSIQAPVKEIPDELRELSALGLDE